MSAISASYVVMGFFFLLWLLWTDIQICRSPHAKITLGFTVKSKFMPAHAMSHKHNSQGQHTLQDCILQIADSSTVTMWFSSLMKGFSSQSLTRALKSLPVYPPSYSTVASVRPQERLLTKHGLSILPQLLGCSDIHHSWDQEAPENYQRAWRGKRDIGSFHNEWGKMALSRLQVSHYFFMLSDTVWWHLEDHRVVTHLLAHDHCAVQFWRFHKLHGDIYEFCIP